MRYIELRKLKEKAYFTIDDVAKLLGINISSAKVLCVRYIKKGFFIRLKKNIYILQEKWEQNSAEDFFLIGNILQVPSYISLMTALSFYGISTQIQRNYFESINLHRSIEYEIKESVFKFYKIKKEYYFDFIKNDNYFIATKEKAFIDAVYLYSFGKYAFDINSLDIKQLDLKKINKIIKIYPDKTQRLIKRLCKI